VVQGPGVAMYLYRVFHGGSMIQSVFLIKVVLTVFHTSYMPETDYLVEISKVTKYGAMANISTLTLYICQPTLVMMWL